MGKLQDEVYMAVTDVYHTKTEARKIFKLVKADIQKERDKDVPDAVVIRIMKYFVSGAKEMLTYLSKDKNLKEYVFNRRIIEVLEPFLPVMVTDQQIRDFINTLDMSEFKNKMQAMKPIMAHFGSNADGNKVKSILLTI